MTHEETELRYWLANEDWYRSKYTRTWLARTPPDTAGDVLASIAGDAEPESRSPFAVLAGIAAVAGFSPSNAIAGGNPNARKAGIRAALMLADMQDIRSLAPLIRVYETNTNWQSKYQDVIESALKNFLPMLSETEAEENAVLLRTLAARVWNSAALRQDLTPVRTTLLLAVVDKLNLADSESQALLESFAQSASQRRPNRSAVVLAAQNRLGA